MAYTLDIGSQAPNFSMKATDGKIYRLSNFSDHGILVIFFTCNHCPYALGSDEITRKTADNFYFKGIRFVAINSNIAEDNEEDSFESMVKRVEENCFPWLYLHDQTQKFARAFGVSRTPHFFVFDETRRLVYSGSATDQPHHSSKITENHLEKALSELLTGKPVSIPVTDPIGCSIKWKRKDKKWMPSEACDLV